MFFFCFHVGMILEFAIVYLVHLDTTLDSHITPNIKSEDIQKEQKMTCVYMCHVEMIFGKSMDSLCIPGL